MPIPTIHHPSFFVSKPGNADLSGQKLDDFLLVRPLGQGGMAKVYLARQESLDREVAVKILKPDLAADENYVKRFQLEARAIAALVHSNIVQVYGVGVANGLHYMAQEYVRGTSLQQLVQTHGPLDLKRSMIVMKQVAAGLSIAGQRGIVHRDIKPDNILISENGEVKIADFGLARSTPNQSTANQTQLTEVGVTMGTPLYMSPEQVQGEKLDHRSDIYSFGVTCYYMLSGKTPFEGETPLSIAVQHMNAAPQTLFNQRPDIPSEVCELVQRMLAKNRDDRIQSAGDIVTAVGTTDAFDGELTWGEVTDSPISPPTVEGPPLLATQKLSAVMKKEADEQSRKSFSAHWYWLVPSILLAFSAGGLAAWWNRNPPLFKQSAHEEVYVEQQKTAEAQFIYAAVKNTESAWKSVPHYFPESDRKNVRWILRSKQHLAWLYVESDRLDLAFDVFTQLAEVDMQLSDRDLSEFRVFGLAGQATIHAIRNERDDFASKVAEVWPDRNLLDQKTRAQLEQLIRQASLPLPTLPATEEKQQGET